MIVKLEKEAQLLIDVRKKFQDELTGINLRHTESNKVKIKTPKTAITNERHRLPPSLELRDICLDTKESPPTYDCIEPDDHDEVPD